jgi:hypothetical protein
VLGGHRLGDALGRRVDRVVAPRRGERARRVLPPGERRGERAAGRRRGQAGRVGVPQGAPHHVAQHRPAARPLERAHLVEGARRRLARPEVARQLVAQRVGVGEQLAVELRAALEGALAQHAGAEAVDGGDGRVVEALEGAAQPLDDDGSVPAARRARHDVAGGRVVHAAGRVRAGGARALRRGQRRRAAGGARGRAARWSPPR